MSERRQVVLGDREASDRLPEWASMGVIIIEWFRKQGMWTEVVDRLKIQREGGYVGVDAFMLLIYYFTSRLELGLKEFSERAREHHIQLAAVGGRLRLPTQSSISRILGAVENDVARDFGAWLLREAPGTAMTLQHPSVLTRDAMGEGWHVFDWDPTVTTLRHRALPLFDGMPDARRRSTSLAEPGYAGRKRGDVQFSRATLQHAGSGLWLGIEMGAGNGTQRHAIDCAIQQVIATCKHAALPSDRVILRADGAAGNVPFITACATAGIHYITRLAHYQLLEDKDVVRHLNEAAWFSVPSSGSGPTRQSADLGEVMLEPAPTTLQADGTPFAPIRARVVVSRFPCAEEGRGAGVVVDGWQYELYGTDLSASAWPEREIVAGYYARTGQENRFFQEDCELGLDRIFSYHLPGQLLATLIGLFVWNFYVCRGMSIARPPNRLPEQALQQGRPLVQTPRLPEADSTRPAVATTPAGAESNGPAAANAAAAHSGDDTADATRTFAAEACIEPKPSADCANAASSAGTSQDNMLNLLNAVAWEQVLEKHDGWSWDAAQGALRCPAKAPLPLVRIEQVKNLPIRARFQAEWGGCDRCELRSACFDSNDLHYRKDVRLPIPAPYAEPLREMSLRGQRPTGASTAPKRRASAIGEAPMPRPIWRIKPLSWQPTSLPPQRPPLEVASPTLLPAELRKITRQAARRIEIHVAVDLPPTRPRLSPVLAPSTARRQQRRLTWTERLSWNKLPEGSGVEIRLLGAAAVKQLLAPSEPTTNLPKSA